MLINGFGSVVQLDKSKTRYKCRKWMLQVDTDTGRHQKRFTGSLKEARKELDEYITHLENNLCTKNIIFSKYSEYWLNIRIISKNYSPNTLSTNKRCVRALNKLFGDKHLNNIQTKEIREKIYFLKNKNGVNIGNWYRKKLLDTLNLIFKMAIDDNLVSKNPAGKIKKPKPKKQNKRSLTRQEFNEVIKCLKLEKTNGKQIALFTILYLGLRRSEVCPLKWKDYNRQEGTLTIQRAWKDGNATIGDTKSPASVRTLPMPAPLIEIYEDLYNKSTLPLSDEDFICLNSFGFMLKTVALYEYWNDFCKRYNLNYVSLHELRHTNLTIVSRYMSPFDLQHYAGWSDLEPAQIYIHKDQTTMRRAINRVEF